MELDEKTKELIAVGATITANNQSSLEYHLKIALEEGSDAEEIAEAIEMGKHVRKGAADKMDEFSTGSKDCGFTPLRWNKSACCG